MHTDDTTTRHTDAERRALMLVSDPELLDTILRLAAAAGCELHRAVDATQARAQWARAPLVLLDVAAAGSCSRAGLPRRSDVVIAVRGDPTPAVWKQAVEVGADRVVALPEAETWLVGALADAAQGVRSGGAVLAVVGGRGGAGASVFAAAVGITAARAGEQVLLVDCDPLGGGLDLVLGAEDLGGLRWPGIDVGDGRIPAAALHAALPAPAVTRGERGELALLACGRSDHGPAPTSVRAVIESGRRSGEIVVCDLPRYPTEAAVAAITASDLVTLVVPADVRACASAAQVAAVLAEHGGDVRLVVRGPAPGGVAPEEVAQVLGLPLLAAMRPETGIAVALERGSGAVRARGPLAAAARRVLTELRGVAGHGVRS